MRCNSIRIAAAHSHRRCGRRLAFCRPARVGADLRLRHAAAGHAQSHHRVRHLQDHEGEGRHEHAGAADRRRPGHQSAGRARRGRDRHHQHHGGAGRARWRAEGHAHHLRRPCAAHAAVRAQGLRHVQERRPQGQARDHGLFGHAQHRQDRARHAGERRPHRGRRQAGAGSQRGAQRRRVHRRQRRHVLLRLRRPEGEGGRRHRRRHPGAGDRRGAACPPRKRSCHGPI